MRINRIFKFCFFSLVLMLPIFQPIQAQDTRAPIPYEEIMAFSRIFETIRESYVEPVDDAKLMEDAIRGMIAGLDPHSTLLDQRDASQIRINTSGEYGGLGMEVTKDGNVIKVISPFDDSPADREGIRPGDLIIRIGGTAIGDLSLQEAVELMRGVAGSEVELTIVRAGRNQPFTVTLTREVIKLKSVRSYALEPNFGYTRITMFQATTANLLNAAIRSLYEEEGDLYGVVLDLRNNPGGALRSAVEVSDLFIDDGVIVSIKGRDGVKGEFKASPGDLLQDVPIVVLVNEGSASASEIVAGALQDHERAVIMGTKTFGKGSVQSILDITQDTAIKLTTSFYYTPNDRSFQSRGIEPDIVVANRVIEESGENSQSFSESDLPGAFENENGEEISEDELVVQHPSVAQDYQLQQALNLLKGLRIHRSLSASG